MTQTQRVGILLVPGFGLMSYACAVEPLRAANSLSGRPLYVWSHIVPTGDRAVASCGAELVADHRVGEDAGPLDLLLICAAGDPAHFQHAPTFRWLRQVARSGLRVAGVSVGPYVMARAGLLDGYRCTVHWECVPAFIEAFPHLDLTRSLYELDRDRLTCSGGMAVLDLMHALIGADFGYRLADAVTDWYVHTHVREGSGPQRMAVRYRYRLSDQKLVRVLEEMERRIEDPMTRRDLAALAGVSVRQLERLFATHVGSTVSAHYLRIRAERARLLLRQSAISVTEVAIACGFMNASHFSRSYRRQFGLAPRQERVPTPAFGV